ncbi:MAG: phytanoyl-CoA dioxygenase family protein [Planctomycetes bacterium]|nr:phytanoyl-CoA dioxygenase family protein [Planctomycetota bacterium]
MTATACDTAPPALDEQEVRHLSDHGWVLLVDVLDDRACGELRDGLDEMARTRRLGAESTTETTVVEHATFYSPLFLRWLELPRVIAANRQAMGQELLFQGDNAFIKRPHIERTAAADRLADPDGWGWHRGLRPKHGNQPHDDDPCLLNFSFLNNITYLSDVSAGDGATAILDGSHRHEGTYASLKQRCPIVQPSARRGSVLLFTETLIHAGVPILSERVRHCMFHGFVPRFPWPPPIAPPVLLESILEPCLRLMLGGRCP